MEKKEKIELAVGLGITVLSLGVYVWDVLERKKQFKKHTKLLKTLSENECNCNCHNKNKIVKEIINQRNDKIFHHSV